MSAGCARFREVDCLRKDGQDPLLRFLPFPFLSHDCSRLNTPHIHLPTHVYILFERSM